MGTHSPFRKIQTLNSVQDLSGVTFGHKFPRCGLKLLHWLANDWIVFYNQGMMWAKTDPKFGEFGFHIFHNRENILPLLLGDQRYFMVGNLRADGADDLPFGEADTGSNIDRIIVRMDFDQVIGEVYVTEHTPHHNSFRSDSTYRISRGLIKHMQNLEENDFLQRAGYIPERYEYYIPQSRQNTINIEGKDEVTVFPRESRSSRDNPCSCVIL